MSGWNSCGSAMDFLRSCYYSEMALYRDRPELLVPGRWRWCQPGAKVVPFVHGFGSINWLSDNDRIPPVSIPEKALGAYYNGRSSPAWTGQGVCGDAEAWLLGGTFAGRGTMPLGDNGAPVCCGGPPLPVGGLVGDGAAAFWTNA